MLIIVKMSWTLWIAGVAFLLIVVGGILLVTSTSSSTDSAETTGSTVPTSDNPAAKHQRQPQWPSQSGSQVPKAFSGTMFPGFGNLLVAGSRGSR